MNNSFLALENVDLQLEANGFTEGAKDMLSEREGELVGLIDALQGIQSSIEWNVLRDRIFAPLEDRLTKELAAESRSDSPDPLKLARISGQLKWAERYADLGKLESEYRAELTGIRRKLHGKT